MCLSEILYQVPYLNDLYRIKANGGLVQNNSTGIAKQRLRNADALPVALGQCRYESVSHIPNARADYDVFHLRFELRAAETLRLAYELQILLRSLIYIQRRLLRQITDAPFCRLRFVENIMPVYRHFARRR